MNEKVVNLLNEARERELLAISQYMVEHYELEDAGYGKLGDKMKEIAIVEMKHAEDLAERILFLGGVPSTKPQSGAQKGLSIPDLLKVNMGLEKDAIEMYNKSAQICAGEHDQVTKQLFERILHQEEDHWDDFDLVRDHVEKLGNVYLTTLLD